MARSTKSIQTRGRKQAPHSKNLIHLADENWGDRLHRAYRTARRNNPGLTYRQVAQQLSRIFPTTDATVIRLENYDDVPSQQRVRALAYLVVLAYGFDPGQFGLDESNTGLDPQIIKTARDLLIRSKSWIPNDAA